MKQSGIVALLVIAFLSCAFTQDQGAATGSQCGPVQCLEGQTCCNDVVYGPLCFDNQNYACLSSEDGTNRLCPQQYGQTTAGVCGSTHTCYYVENQACVLGYIVPRTGGPGTHVEEPTPTPSPQPTMPPQPSPQPQPSPGTEQPQPPSGEPGTEPQPQPTTPTPEPAGGGTEQPTEGSGLSQGGQQVGGQCGSVTCLEGSTCCQDVFYGGLCFTSDTYACLSTSSGAQRLCPQPTGATAGVCGTANVCYFTSTHSCVNGEVTALQTEGAATGADVSGAGNPAGSTEGSSQGNTEGGAGGAENPSGNTEGGSQESSGSEGGSNGSTEEGGPGSEGSSDGNTEGAEGSQ